MAEFNNTFKVYRSYRKASLVKQLVVKLERIITVAQEWLENKDRPIDLILGYGFVVMAFLFMVGQIVRCLV